jgi:tetratricopeptide (TPR) repeat protein
VQAPDNAQFARLGSQANVLFQAKRYSEAIDYCKKAMAIRPEDPRPYGLIALSMAYLKKPEAVDWAKKAIAKDPRNGWCRGILSSTYTLRGKWREGLEPSRAAVTLSPREAWLYHELGHCLLHVKKFDEAVPVLQKAVELDPQNASYHALLSDALFRLKDKKGAEHHLRTALALKPDSPHVQNTLGWRLRERGRGREADESFREALRLNPRSKFAKFGLGAPAGKRAGPADHILRFSMTLTSISPRTRKILNFLQIIGFLGFLDLVLRGPYGNLWQVQVIAAGFLGWIIYYTFAWHVVMYVARRRDIHFH